MTNHRRKTTSPIGREKGRQHLTPQEVARLLAAAKTPGLSRNPERDYCLLFLMARHGLRLSEATQLRLSDVDLAARKLYIRRAKLEEPSEHPIYNGGELKAIRDWLRARQEMRADSDLLFLSERRRRLSHYTVWLIVQKYAEAASLEHLKVHPHSLRHSTGYDLVNKGIDTRTIQDYLGHRSIQSTVRYTKLRADRFANLYK